MAYTYADFLKEADGAGLLKQFSSYDLETAKLSPEFGKSLLSYKKDYNAATSAEARAVANAGAEALRKKYGYTAGKSGSAYYAEESAGPYARRKQELISEIAEPEAFSYDAASDPSYSAYKKQYLREGQRAGEHTLGTAAAQTGGRASSYAVTAASQAEDNYAAKLTDKLPELEEAAYQRYLKGLQQKADALAAVTAADDSYYKRQRDAVEDSRYADETAYQRQRDAVSDERYEEEKSYDRSRDAASDQRYADETAYQKERDAVADSQFAAEQALEQDKLQLQRDKLTVSGSREKTAEASEAEGAAGLSEEQIAELTERYGGTQLSESQWNRLLAEYPEYSAAMLQAAGFAKNSDTSRAEPSSTNIDSIRETARKLAEEGHSNQNIRNRLWTLWRIGSITDSEWREFQRIYS